MGALLRDLRFAARMLAKSPAYTLVAILTLAIGIGANTAIFSTVNAVLLRPLPFPEPDRLIVITESQPTFPEMSLAYPNLLAYAKENQTFTAIGGFRGESLNLTGQGEPERLEARAYTQNLLTALGVSPRLGRNFVAEEDAPDGPRAVLLTDGFWKRRFAGDPAIVGKTITLDGQPWTVVGVMAPAFRVYGTTDVIVPMGRKAKESCFTSHGCHPGINGIGRLKPGVTLAQARADLRGVGDGLQRLSPDNYGPTRPKLQSMREDYGEEYRSGVLLLLGAVTFVLLIAAANVANLMLSRAMTRQKEMGIRAALGSGRWRLVRQLLVESTLLALIGGALGLLLALWGVDLLAAARPQAVELLGDIDVDRSVLAYTLVTALGTGLLFGLVPAIYASRQDLSQALKEGDHRATAGGGQLRVRNLLVIVEVALALVLLVGAGLSMRSFARLTEVDTGFQPGRLLSMDVALPRSRYPDAAALRGFWDEVKRRVEAVPGVESVAITNGMPFADTAESSFRYPEDPPGTEHAKMAVAYFVGPGYFESLKIPLLAGRYIGPEDRAGTKPVLVIDQEMAEKYFPGKNPIGQRLAEGMTDEASVEIVGVVGHVAHYGLDGEAARTRNQMYYSYAQLPEKEQARTIAGMSIVVRSQGDPLALTRQVRAEVLAVDPEQPVFAITSVEQLIAGSLAERRFTISLLGIFAVLALILAGVGLYAVMSSSVSQRTHELGVRMALGAQAGDVVRLVVGKGLLLVAIGVGVGLLGSFGLTRVIASILGDRVSPTDPLTFAGVALLLVAVGLLATYIPARRATRVDPMVALRHE